MQLAALGAGPGDTDWRRAGPELPGPGRRSPALRLQRASRALRDLGCQAFALLEAAAGRTAQETAPLPGPRAAATAPVRPQEGRRRAAPTRAPHPVRTFCRADLGQGTEPGSAATAGVVSELAAAQGKALEDEDQSGQEEGGLGPGPRASRGGRAPARRAGSECPAHRDLLHREVALPLQLLRQFLEWLMLSS